MIIKGKKVLINDQFKKNLFLKIKGSQITNILKSYKGNVDYEFEIIAPGFIDNHTHGAGGHDFMEANQKAYTKILKTKVKSGITSLFATSITQSEEKILKMINYTIKHKHQEGEAQILGIHMEGPFVSKIKKGAQPERYIIKPNVKLLEKFFKASQGQLKIITYAPEEDEEMLLTKYCAKNNIKAQIGHTMANENQVSLAIKNGAKGVTHAYNAMPKSLENETTGFCAKSDLYGEIIADGIHNTFSQVEDFIKIKKVTKSMLITDSLMCAGCVDGEYLLGGEKIFKKGLEVRIASGNIAGSVAGMIDVVKNIVLHTNFSLEDALVMASKNVADYHKLKNKGRIKIGYDADLIALSKDVDLKMTMVLGKVVS